MAMMLDATIAVRASLAQERDIEVAALAPQTLQQVCVAGVDQVIVEPARQIEACNVVIEGRTLAAPDLATARLARALAETRLGRPAEASADYREAARLFGTVIDPVAPNPVFTFRRATAYHALGQIDLALPDYDTTIRMAPKTVLAFLDRGIVLRTYKGELYTALADFDQAVALAPDNVAALALRGDTLAALGRFGPAVADLGRAIARMPDNPRLYVLRGLANGQRGEVQLALADYERALTLDPGNVEALVDRAALKAGTGDHDGAVADLDRALSVQPANAVALYNRGFSRFARLQYERAIADYTAAITINPDFGMALNNRCLSRVVVGRELDEARADCRRAIGLLPHRADVQETQGFVHLKLDEPKEAFAHYTAALKIDARRPLALFGRGIARERLGDAAGARADKRDALALNSRVEHDFSLFGVH
jgi:tetratricopeptide (TPR) repeat protein